MPERTIGYGLMRLTGDGVWGPPTDWDDAVALLREAYELGVRLMDSAWYYGPHVTHRLLVEAFHPYPEDLVVVTKAGNSRTTDRGWAPALAPSDLREAVDLDLKLLQLESLPLVLLRWNPRPDDVDRFAEAVSVMTDLQQAGKIRAIGLSNVTLELLHVALGMTAVAAVSNAYSLDNRADADVLDACALRGIRYLPYYPLLGGHVLRQAAVQRTARRLGVAPAQLAIAWLCAQSPVVVPIPGTRSPQHLRDNIAAQRFVLPADVVAALEQTVRATTAG